MAANALMASAVRGERDGLYVVAAALASHATYLTGGFTWHDHGDILLRRVVDGPLLAPFGTSGFWRPLVALSLRLDHALYGLNPAGYHATNVLWHALACWLAWRACRLWLTGQAALFAGVLFAVHPLSWLPVGAISYRSEPMVAAAVLASASVLANWLRSGSLGALFGASALALSALACKETAWFWLPCAWLAVPGHRSRRKTVALAVLAVGLGTVGALRSSVLNQSWRVGTEALPPVAAVMTRAAAIGGRLHELTGAQVPSLSDAVQISGMRSVSAWGGLAFVAMLLFAAWRCRSRASVLTGAGIALLVIVLPACNLLPLPRWSSPHYWYLAPLPIGAAAWSVLGRRTSGWLWLWPAAAAAITFSAGDRFKDDHSLFRETEIVAAFREGHQWRGHACWSQRPPNVQCARRHFEAALAPHDGYIAYVDAAAVMFNLAAARAADGDKMGAERLLKTLVRRPPAEMVIQTHELLAELQLRRGAVAAACAHLAVVRASWSPRGQKMGAICERLGASGGAAMPLPSTATPASLR